MAAAYALPMVRVFAVYEAKFLILRKSVMADKLIVISMTNKRLEKLANNLLTSLRRLNIPISMHNIYLPGAEYGSSEFQEVVMHKIRIVCDALSAGHHVLWTDVDIAFRRDPRQDLLDRLSDYDVVFQQSTERDLCSGFFAVKPSPASLEFFDKDVLIAMRSPKYLGDEKRIRRRFRENPNMVKLGYLPIDLYPSGWHQQNLTLREHRFITHYNYRRKTSEKIAAMKACGDWFLDCETS